MRFQPCFCLFATLSNLFAIVTKPRTTLLDKSALYRCIQNASRVGNTFTKDNFEFGGFERRCDLVLYNLYASFATNNVRSILNLVNTSNVQTNAGVEFERLTTCCCFGATKHNANFVTKLVDKDDASVGFVTNCNKLTQCLRHQARLNTHVTFAHVAFKFGFWCQCSNRVHNNEVNSVTTNKVFQNVQRLLTTIWLRDVQFVKVDTKILCVNWIQCLFSIDKCRCTAHFLNLCDNVQCYGCFT